MSEKETTGFSETRLLKYADRVLLCGYAGSIFVVYCLDAIFFAAWAPTLWLMPLFILIGFAIRSVAVGSGPVMQVVAKVTEDHRAAGVVRGLSIAAALLCLVPALSFFAGGHQTQTNAAETSKAVTDVSDTNKASRIATKIKEIERLDSETKDAVAETNRTIQAIVDDDVPGISAEDNVSIAKLRAEIKAYRESSAASIKAIQADISKIEAEKEEVQSENATASNHVNPVYAIFQVVAKAIGGAAASYAMTVLFSFAMLMEAIAFFGLGAYQALHRAIQQAIQDSEIREIEHCGKLESERIAAVARAEEQRKQTEADGAARLRRMEEQETIERDKAEALARGETEELWTQKRAADERLAEATAKLHVADIDAKIKEIEAKINGKAPRKSDLSRDEGIRQDADPIKIPVGDWPERDGRTTMEEAAG